MLRFMKDVNKFLFSFSERNKIYKSKLGKAQYSRNNSLVSDDSSVYNMTINALSNAR